MANTYFFTGFPGFIATSLIRQMIQNHYEIKHMYLLVQPSFMQKAAAEVENLVIQETISKDQFTLIPGDITKTNLDIPSDINSQLREDVSHVFHLAAIYDLAVPQDIAYNVNVNGTKNVNDWLMQLKHLKRYVYFSTAYVSGTREGRILETELEMNQSFKNHYEHSKYEAEKLVQGIIDRIPTTIIRPGIVRGHSKTGETIKFDGIYFFLNFFDKLRFLPIIPYLGEGEAEGNFVPVDYVFNATLYLGHADAGVGKTYHLTDPRPFKMREVYRMLMKEYLGRQPVGTIPLSAAKWLLSSGAIRKWIRNEKEALDYFTYKSVYDCSQAQTDLQGSNIACPDLKETLCTMIHFYKENKNNENYQLKIT